MASSSAAEALRKQFATNEWSLFQDFQIKLKNGATLTGIVHIPAAKERKGWPARPLMVGIHGGTCCAYVYDVAPEYTASIYSDILDIPFVAINRPNYLDSSGWVLDASSDDPFHPRFTKQADRNYFQEEAVWYHELIFPALWEAFAKPNGCTSLVTNSHSISVPATVVASNLYTATCEAKQDPGYVWSGMVLSGFSTNPSTSFLESIEKRMTHNFTPSELPFGHDSRIHLPPFFQKDKEEVMLGPLGVCDEKLRPLIWKQNTPLLKAETEETVALWPQIAERCKAAVKMPVLYALGEYDWLWQGTKENADSFCQGFVSCPRIESAVIKGAPHMIEMSEAGVGWGIRVMGWAIEVDVSRQAESSKVEKYSWLEGTN